MTEQLSFKSSNGDQQLGNTYGLTLPSDFGHVSRPDLSGFLAGIAENEPRDMDGRTVAERFYGDRPSTRLTPLDAMRMAPERISEILAMWRQELPKSDTVAAGMDESFATTTHVDIPITEQLLDQLEKVTEPEAAVEIPQPEASAQPESSTEDDKFVSWLKNMPPGIAEGQTVDTLHKIFMGETSFTQLAQEARRGREPIFTNAGTGEQLSLADVKAHMAAADTSPESIGMVADFAAETIPDDPTVEHEFGIDPEGRVHETQTMPLNGVELKAVLALDGTVEEVSVHIEGEGNEEAGETHTVTVVEPTPEHPAIVAIDDEPVTDPKHLATAAQVVEHAAELASEKQQDATPAASPEQPAAIEEATTTSQEQTPEGVSKSSEPTEARQQQLLRGAHDAIQAYVSYPETAAAMQTLGVDFNALSDKFRTGEVDLTGETARALRELIKEVKPTSSLWATRPGADSLLGRAADAERVRLANILKSF